jgi:hypothetical protein
MGAIGTSVVDATAAEWRQATVCMASRPAGYQITDLGLMRRGRSCSLAPSITGAQVVLAQRLRRRRPHQRRSGTGCTRRASSVSRRARTGGRAVGFLRVKG